MERTRVPADAKARARAHTHAHAPEVNSRLPQEGMWGGGEKGKERERARERAANPLPQHPALDLSECYLHTPERATPPPAPSGPEVKPDPTPRPIRAGGEAHPTRAST